MLTQSHAGVTKRGAIFGADNNLHFNVSLMDGDVYFCGGLYGFNQSFEENITVSVRGKLAYILHHKLVFNNVTPHIYPTVVSFTWLLVSTMQDLWVLVSQHIFVSL